MSQKILAVALPAEQYTLLQQKAIAQQKEVAQLGLEIIRNWLRQQTEIEENVASKSKDKTVHKVNPPYPPLEKGEAEQSEVVHEVSNERSEQALEAVYREYYANAEDDLRIVRNMHSAQMHAFERSHQEKS